MSSFLDFRNRFGRRSAATEEKFAPEENWDSLSTKDLATRLRELHTALTGTNDELQRRTSSLTVLQKDLVEARHLLLEGDDKRRALASRVFELEASLTVCRSAKQAAVEKLSSENSRLLERFEKLSSENTTCKSSLENTTSAYFQCQQALAASTVRCEAAEKKAIEADNERQKQLMELRDCKDEISKLKSDNASLSSQLSRARNSLKDTEGRFAVLKAENAVFKSSQTELVARTEALEESARSKTRVCQALNEAMTALQDKASAAETANSVLHLGKEALEKQVEEMEALQEERKAALEVAESDVERLGAALAATKLELAQRTKQLENVTSEKRSLQAKSELTQRAAEERIQRLEGVETRVGEEVAVLRQEKASLEKKLVAVVRELKLCRSQSSQTKGKLTAVAKQASTVTAQLTKSRRLNEQLREQSVMVCQSFAMAKRDALFSAMRCEQFESAWMGEEDDAGHNREIFQLRERLRRLHGGWREVEDRGDLAPTITMQDPVIQFLLTNWTTDERRVTRLTSWLTQVCSGEPLSAFQRRVEVNRLAPEVLEGFMKLVIPLLRQRGGFTVRCFARERPEVRTDLRISVEPVPGIAEEEKQATPEKRKRRGMFRRKQEG